MNKKKLRILRKVSERKGEGYGKGKTKDKGRQSKGKETL